MRADRRHRLWRPRCHRHPDPSPTPSPSCSPPSWPPSPWRSAPRPPPVRCRPASPAASSAQSQLNALTVRTEGSMTGYSRDKFPHWIIISGACDTRETVLKRDGTGVVVNSSCAATSGSWYSPYDGITEHAASDIDIDHVVALAEAWRSGASSWTTSRRQSFANSLSTTAADRRHRQLQPSKGDQRPRRLAAQPHRLPLHLRPHVDRRQVPVGPQPPVRREVRPPVHAQHLLTPRENLEWTNSSAPSTPHPTAS